MQPRWVKDLITYIDSVPFGNITIPQIKRVAGKTVQIDTISKETLRYEGVEQAMEDLQKYLKAAEESGYDGEVTFAVKLKQGKIKEIAFFNQKHSTYNA